MTSKILTVLRKKHLLAQLGTGKTKLLVCFDIQLSHVGLNATQVSQLVFLVMQLCDLAWTALAISGFSWA